jgi:signal transduction histidine kinase/streptogramin lyase
VTALFEDSKGRFWVGTAGGGFYGFEPESGEFTNYGRPASARPYPQEEYVTTIAEDPEGGLWFSSSELNWFDPDNGTITTFAHDPLDPYSVSSNVIPVVYGDRHGVLWVANLFKGINRLDRSSRPFEHLYPIPGNANSLELSSYGVLSIRDAPDGALWVSSGGVLNRVDRETNEYTRYRPEERNPKSLASGADAIAVESSGVVWIGAVSVLSRMEPTRPGYFQHLRTDESDTTSLPPGRIRSILVDSKGVVWVAHDAFGISRLDNWDEGTFTRFRLPPPFGWINTLYEDLDGFIWIATQAAGLFRFDPATEEIVAHPPSSGVDGLSSGQIYGICENPAEPGILWIGAYGGGLNRFDKSTGLFSHFTVQNSDLPDNGAQGVLCDPAGYVWVSTDVGLTRYNPVTGWFKNYSLDDGLQGLSFNSWAYHMSPFTGEMFFGGINGVNSFFPADLADNPNPPDVLINRLKLFDEPVEVGDNSPLESLLSETESFTLKHNQNDVTFDYVGLHYSDPERNEYAYKLEPYDEDWRAVGKRRSATFTNLDPGEYTFRVKAANSDGVWNEEGASVRMTILPPWWRTLWAYAIYGILLVGGVIGVDRLQRRRLVRKERERAAITEAVLRADAAEADSRALEADFQRKKNVELLGEIGKEITSSLDIDTIFDRLYERVNEFMDADSFGVGLYDPEGQKIEYRLAIERGIRYAPYTRDTTDKNQFPVWCVENRLPVFINDVSVEYSRFIAEYDDRTQELEDGSVAELPQSLIYVPLTAQEQVLGVITVQSVEKNAYTEHHLNVVEALAAYTSIALDNADAYRKLGATLDKVKSMQMQMVTQEKLASLGALTAGIAHEIQNPLNFVNNFAEIVEELVSEMNEELESSKDKRVADVLVELDDLLSGIRLNAGQIVKYGKRADRIVKNMMEHAAVDSKERYRIDVNAFVEEYIDLAYQGKKSQTPGLDVRVKRNFDDSAGSVELAPRDMSRVLVNLLGNAFDAVHEKGKRTIEGYYPQVTVSTERKNSQVLIRVADNGDGIPSDLQEKIFEPFFTTKPAGSGTGLGLSLSHDIVTQGHGGSLTVESEEGKGALFVISLAAN